MRRRIEGFVNQGKRQNEDRQQRSNTDNQSNTGNQSNTDNQNESKFRQESRGSNQVCFPKDQLISSIADLAKTNAERSTQNILNRQQSEISEELVSKIIEQYQQQVQSQAQQSTVKQDEQIRKIVAKVVQGETGSSGSTQQPSQDSSNLIVAANDNALRQQQGNQQKGQQGQPANNKENPAQVLSAAQYELSRELEDSLSKLREVIDKSRQIAQQMSETLGQNAGKFGSEGNNNQQN